VKRFPVTPTKFLKRFLPHSSYFHEHKSLRFLTRVIDPNIWHLNRRSVSGGLWIGIFLAFQPIPLQMPIAALLAIWTRVNLPLAVLTTWITNPLTFYPIYYLNFSVGCFFLGIDGTWSAADFSWDAIVNEAWRLMVPLFLGSFVAGLTIATSCYWLTRLAWRMYILHRWGKKMIDKKRSE